MPTSRRRPLWVVMLALVLASGALWWSSRLVWASQLRVLPGGAGTTDVWRSGAEVVPALLGLAVVALAGVAGVVAVGGWLRRVLAVLLGLAGLVAVGVAGFAGGPAELPFLPWGRVLAGLAGVLLVLAGVLVLRFADRLPALGTAYRPPDEPTRSADPDRALWQALSEGRDPTTEDR